MYVGGPWGHSDSFNKAFQFAKGLPMPRTGDGNGSNLVLCNGMDVVSGSVFYHKVTKTAFSNLIL